MATRKVGAVSHCWDLHCLRRGRVQGLRYDQDDVRLLVPQRLVHEQDRPVRLLPRQPPQRHHTHILDDDVQLQDLRDDQVRHLPEPIEPQRVDDPRDKVESVRKLDVRPAPPDAVDDSRRQAEDRDAGLLCQVAEDKTVLPNGDRPQERPVREDKAGHKERRRADRHEDVLREDHQGDAEDKGHLVEALDGGAGGVGALGLVFEIARGSGYAMTLPTGVD